VKLLAAFCLAVALLTACASPEARQTSGEAVLFVRSGGIAGADDRLSIGPDGAAVLLRRKSPAVETHLTPAERDSLHSALDRAVLSAPSRGLPGPPGPPDTYTYSVTLRGSTVHVPQTAVPPGLRELVGVLLDITNRLAHNG
jgi:hypothetical protein